MSSQHECGCLTTKLKVFVADQKQRISVSEIKAHPFFAPINWKLLAAHHVEAPYIPEVAPLTLPSYS